MKLPALILTTIITFGSAGAVKAETFDFDDTAHEETTLAQGFFGNILHHKFRHHGRNHSNRRFRGNRGQFRHGSRRIRHRRRNHSNRRFRGNHGQFQHGGRRIRHHRR